MAEQTEKWVSTDDRGTRRTMVVAYDERGHALVSREYLREIMTLAGMRLDLDAEAADA